MHLVIVESPAKAKTINKYLGSDFQVLASYGHIRDLPSKNGSVQPDEDFSMTWEMSPDSKKHFTQIKNALKDADILYLATDPDREGEAISWHLCEALKSVKNYKNLPVKRVVFNEITKNAVTHAIAHPRDLNQELVDAYLARRALDYLVGFTLSPLLWRRLPGSRSAGRVQSVALRLICDRETDIEAFITQEYWSISGYFHESNKTSFSARLVKYQNNKIEKFSFTNEKETKSAVQRLEKSSYHIDKIEKKQKKRQPYPPFTTSTLQQEASRKLGFSASKTMRIAQQLYEGIALQNETVGLITYMRTDSINLSQEAIASMRETIQKDYGKPYLPSSPRLYKSKAKNAQEAHEAIRPTNITRTPKNMKSYIDSDQFKLYDLIWKRALASQMENAIYNQVIASIISDDCQHEFRATGSTIYFDGFLKLYQESIDDPSGDSADEDKTLPPLQEKAKLNLDKVDPQQHFTEPPPRFTEASLVKKLEELGIGRPSTYASIISVLQARGYVTLQTKRFFPEERGRLVISFLKLYFSKYVEYDFTANMEDLLDEVSNAKQNWKMVLKDFWSPFFDQVKITEKLPPQDILKAIENELHDYLYKNTEKKENNMCPTCNIGELELKVSKFGAFLGCSHYPECKYTTPVTAGQSEGGNESDVIILGNDPKTQKELSCRKGPYGFYIQREDDSDKPKRVPLPKSFSPADLTLEQAISLIALPREIGLHPETQKMITAAIGRFGPYVKHESTFVSLPPEDDVLTVGINRAIDLLATKSQPAGKEIGVHPDDKKPILLQSGRYGPYLKYKTLNVAIPKSFSPESLTLEQAVDLINKKKKAPKKK